MLRFGTRVAFSIRANSLGCVSEVVRGGCCLEVAVQSWETRPKCARCIRASTCLPCLPLFQPALNHRVDGLDVVRSMPQIGRFPKFSPLFEEPCFAFLGRL